MNMKRFSAGLIVLTALAGTFAGCDEERITYSGPSYVMFADTLSVCPVRQSGEAFGVPVVATRPADHDRTFAVEVLTEGRHNAVYGEHYTIESQTVTIPAGQYTTTVNITGNYEKVESGDSLFVRLRLAPLEDVEWDLYGLDTKVQLQKVCPFDIHDYTGYCVVTSSFYMKYMTNVRSRLITSEVVEGKKNTIRLKDFYYEGTDIEVELDDSDPLNPCVWMTGEQVIADTRDAFGTIYGNGRVLADDAVGIRSPLYPCDRGVILYLTLRVADVGTVGSFYHIIEWISDDQAQDIIDNGF